METFKITSLLTNENYITHLSNGLHQIVGDEPIEKGGQHQGFNPFELVLAGLALCKSATMRMYAERKGWQTGEIDVKISMEYDRELTPRIVASIAFGAELNDEQKARLLQIADKCPTHKLLMGEKIIETSLI